MSTATKPAGAAMKPAAGPITEAQIKAFVAGWYYTLDIHAPFAEARRFLADDGLKMTFPDGDITDMKSFGVWYTRVTNLFFDENHYVQRVVSKISGDTAVLDVLVGWQASWFEPPAAKSKRTSMDATQRWTVRRSTKNAYGLEIV